MSDLARCRVQWSGSGLVGPGVSTFYSLGTGAALSGALDSLFSTISAIIPPDVTVQVASSGDVISEDTGDLAGAWSGTFRNARNGGATGSYAMGVGCRIVWQTAGVTAGRRVRGATYIVPLGAAYYAVNGTIVDTLLTTLQTSIDAYRTTMGANAVIWSRRTPDHSGAAHAITSGSVPDKVSWLRSRRT